MITKVTLRSATLHCFRLDCCTVVRILKLISLYPILALCSLSTGVKCLETSFSKQSFFRWVESSRRSVLPVLRASHHVVTRDRDTWAVLHQIAHWILLCVLETAASHCLTTAIGGDARCGCKHRAHFNVKLILINPTACYWSAKFIHALSCPFTRRRGLTIFHFSHTYCVSIMHSLIFLTVTLSCPDNIHAHHVLQFV